jgi:hypothetical protein
VVLITPDTEWPKWLFNLIVLTINDGAEREFRLAGRADPTNEGESKRAFSAFAARGRQRAAAQRPPVSLPALAPTAGSRLLDP